MVQEALLHLDREHYHLDDWTIMPNHVHLVLWPMPGHSLSKILKGRKQYTANQANRMLGRRGTPFWQVESYDHCVRNEEELDRIRSYIRFNPVKAGLCEHPEDWPWGSAARR